MNRKITGIMRATVLVLFVGMLFAGGAAADTVSISTGDATAHDDLFEGAIVTGSSNVDAGICNSRDAFGYMLGSPEPGSVFAQNDTTMRLEFNPGSQTVNQIMISLAEDDTGSGSRAASAIRFYADTGSGLNLVFSQDLGFTYASSYGDNNIIVTANLDTAITTDSWAFEIDSVSGDGLSGARLFEIDGYNVVPEPASVAMLGIVSALGLFLRRRLLI